MPTYQNLKLKDLKKKGKGENDNQQEKKKNLHRINILAYEIML